LEARKQLIKRKLEGKSTISDKMIFNQKLKRYNTSIKYGHENLLWELSKHRYFD
jgi:hypothetical protein